MTKRFQIVARIDPTLRKAVGRAMKQQKTTLNALVEASLEAVPGRRWTADGEVHTAPPTATTASR